MAFSQRAYTSQLIFNWNYYVYSGKHSGSVTVDFLIISLSGFDNVKDLIQASTGPIDVRKENVNMTTTDFFSLFKRFDIEISRDGLLDGLDYTYI